MGNRFDRVETRSRNLSRCWILLEQFQNALGVELAYDRIELRKHARQHVVQLIEMSRHFPSLGFQATGDIA